MNFYDAVKVNIKIYRITNVLVIFIDREEYRLMV